MQFSNDPNVWIIYALIFLLGLLVGLFMTAGGRKKWKTRYYDEVDRHRELERQHEEASREWRERDSLRAAAIKDRDRDGVADVDERPVVDRDRDGIDDRREG